MIGQGYPLVAVTAGRQYLIVGWIEVPDDQEYPLRPVGVCWAAGLEPSTTVAGVLHGPAEATPVRLFPADITEWAVLGEYSHPVHTAPFTEG